MPDFLATALKISGARQKIYRRESAFNKRNKSKLWNLTPSSFGVRVSILQKETLKYHFSCIYMWCNVMTFVNIQSRALIYSCYKIVNRNHFLANFPPSEKWDRTFCSRANANYFMGPSANTKTMTIPTTRVFLNLFFSFFFHLLHHKYLQVPTMRTYLTESNQSLE